MKTRRFALVFTSILLGTTAHAQWLTPMDEGPSAKVAKHSIIQSNPDGVASRNDCDGGISDAFKWYWRQRTFGLGYIPTNALQVAQQQRNAMREASGKGMSTLSAQPQWTLVGPSNIGGRINALAVDPTNANIVYAGAANGGVWKTTDGGTDWIPLTDQMQSVSMGSLAIDPNNTNTIFAGTGELSGSIDAYPGDGLLRSTDGGTSWADVGPTSVAAYSRVIVNPKHSNLVYAAAGRSGGGVLRSSDGGITWSWLAGGLPQSQSVTDLALSMNNDTAVLYAGIAGTGVYISTDGGDAWTILDQLPFTSMYRISLDVDPANWQNVVVLSVNSTMSAGVDDIEGLQVSNDGGQTWSEIDENLAPNGLFHFQDNPPQGWYDVYVKVDPTNFSHMLVGGISIWQTNDQGQTWNDVALSYEGGIHPDQHVAAFASTNASTVYVGNDGGVFLSSDGGSNYTQQTFPLAITQFYGIGIDQTQSDVTYGGTQDNGTVSGASGSDWNGVLGGDGTLTQVDPKTPSIVYCENPDAFPTVLPSGSRNTGLNASIDSVVWLDPFAADATNDIIYWGCQRLAYSKNQGQNWTNCSQVFGSAFGGTTISAIGTFGDGKTVLVGTGGGIVYLTTNNGTSFTDVSGSLPGRSVTWVQFSPTSKTTFYVTMSGFGAGHVFKTTNSGSTWMDISTRLPDIPVNTLVMDPQNPTVLYIGTDVGVFYSPDDGVEWIPYGTGLPNTGIDFMEVQVNNRVLRAGTHGRSIWQVPLLDDVPGIVLPAQRSVWTLGDTASIQWHGFASSITIDLSLDGGSTWQTIATLEADTVYPISKVSYPASENAVIRVSDGTDTLLSPLFVIAQQKAGSQIGTLADVRFYAYDIAYDKDDNVLWATDFDPTEDYIFKLDPDAGTILDSVKIAVNNAPARNGFTGIKYDPTTKNLFLQQVNGTADGNWNSYIYEVDTNGTVISIITSPAAYGTGIYCQGDTLLVADRMVGQIQRAVIPSDGDITNLDFTQLNTLDFSDTRNATYGPRGLSYYPKLNQYLLAYTDFQGTTLNASYLLFLDPETGEEQNAFNISVGDALTNVRGMELDPRGEGNTAWMTVLNTGSSAQIIKVALADGPIGGPVALLTLVPSTVAFGGVDTGKSKTVSASIHNMGTAADTINSIGIAPARTPFSLGAFTLPTILLPGDSIPVTVTFAPHTWGSPSASLTVSSDQDNPQAVFTINGIATINGAGVSPNDAFDNWGIQLSPNPASEYVDVTLDAASPDDAQIKIYDVTGREVRDIPLGRIASGPFETELSTSGIPSGIYFVRVIGTEGEVAATRLAIER